MSALEKLIARLQRDLYKPEREHLRREELEAMQLYNEIAHELAEGDRLIIGGKVHEIEEYEWVDYAEESSNYSVWVKRLDPEHDGS